MSPVKDIAWIVVSTVHKNLSEMMTSLIHTQKPSIEIDALLSILWYLCEAIGVSTSIMKNPQYHLMVKCLTDVLLSSCSSAGPDKTA